MSERERADYKIAIHKTSRTFIHTDTPGADREARSAPATGHNCRDAYSNGATREIQMYAKTMPKKLAPLELQCPKD